jgi:hypothetical protein
MIYTKSLPLLFPLFSALLEKAFSYAILGEKQEKAS